MNKSEIIIFSYSNQSQLKIEVRIEDETVWLTQDQIVSLFDSSKANISEHIKHIIQTGELNKESTVRKIRTVRVEGNREVSRMLTYFNLDMIISIGYRVNSIRGTQFRIWANKILKDYLLKGYAINYRVDKIERKLVEHDQKFDLLIRTNLPPNEGIFFDGQIFDAWQFATELIRSADKSIILVDNYIDETVLDLFTKRKEKVDALIYTKTITKALKTDLQKHNAQYPEIIVNTFQKSHDGFLIIDKQAIYHIGASLKDLGKKWFAFSKMNLDVNEMLGKLDGR